MFLWVDCVGVVLFKVLGCGFVFGLGSGLFEGRDGGGGFFFGVFLFVYGKMWVF